MRKLGVVAGIVGPFLFATVLITLTLVQYPFMRSLGWDPLMHPTFDWPSGLALGPIGWLMTVTFLMSGALMSTFAWGLHQALNDRNGRFGTILLTCAGLAMMGLAFSTDGPITPLAISWHGRVHDLSFMALGLLIIGAMSLLALSFRGRTQWRKLAPFTWVISGLAVPTFTFKGFVFYAFLAAILLWNEAAALRLWRAKDSA